MYLSVCVCTLTIVYGPVMYSMHHPPLIQSDPGTPLPFVLVCSAPPLSPICDPGLPFRVAGDSDTYRVPVSNRPTGNLPDTPVVDSRGMQATRCSRELKYCDGLPAVG